MTKKEAKRYVLRVLAAETRHHIENGSEWTFIGDDGQEMSEADCDRVKAAIEEVADELERRGRAQEGK